MFGLLVRNSGTLSIVWAFVIFGLCATPGQYIPTVSWLEFLSFDKWVHASVFFVLCTLFFITVLKNERPFYYAILAFFLAVVYGGGLEVMQARVFSERSGDWLDFFANSFGCLIAFTLYPKLKRRLNFSSA